MPGFYLVDGMAYNGIGNIFRTDNISILCIQNAIYFISVYFDNRIVDHITCRTMRFKDKIHLQNQSIYRCSLSIRIQLRDQYFCVVLSSYVIDNELIIISVFLPAFGNRVVSSVDTTYCIAIRFSFEVQFFFFNRKRNGKFSVLRFQLIR